MRKITSILVIFIILFLSANLFAKEKRGAELVILKKDGLSIRGELIVVKRNTLLLNIPYSSIEVSIDSANIKTITTGEKSSAREGAFAGFLIAGVLGAVEASTCSGWGCGEPEVTMGSGLYYGLLGGLIGYGIGGLFTGKKIYVFEGKPDSEITKYLRELRKKARISDYL
jgi:hypothetical protein